jgi:2-polyprenyl-6-methoxyphenol hydroxylase-like FAD-dependent oxidoreductase
VSEHDAVIVGARCAGSTLAIELARRGWDVALLDAAEFPSTTISTHGLWPNGLARLDQLGVLDAILAKHDLPMYESRIRGLGNEMAGGYTPVAGFDRAVGPRRVVLDQAGIDVALAAGAKARFGERVVGLLGSGTEEDPVGGVVLENGERIRAPWVFGADGRGSMVARQLGLAKQRQMRGEMAMAYGYWKGIPDDGYGHFDIEYDRVLTRFAVEDGLTMLIANGPPEMTHGTKRERERKYVEMVRRFPETVDQRTLDRAELVTDVAVAPEPLMQGFFRTAAGPGWALVGDAGHFKHPGTAQGISDAMEQSFHVAEALSGAAGNLDGYEAWRDDRAAEHYEWSFAWGHFPKPGSGDALFRGWASEPAAGQDLRDTFSRVCPPSRLTSPERLARYFAQA